MKRKIPIYVMAIRQRMSTTTAREGRKKVKWKKKNDEKDFCVRLSRMIIFCRVLLCVCGAKILLLFYVCFATTDQPPILLKYSVYALKDLLLIVLISIDYITKHLERSCTGPCFDKFPMLSYHTSSHKSCHRRERDRQRARCNKWGRRTERTILTISRGIARAVAWTISPK